VGLLYLVRHGLTVWNREGRYQGDLDVPLAPEGREQALRLGRRLLGTRWDAVWSSDLSRARETAELVAPGAQLRLDAGFREIGYGAWEGLTAAEVRSRFPREFAAYRADPAAGASPGGEAPAAVAARSLAAFRRLWRPEYRRVLLVAHGSVLKSLILGLLGADLALRPRIVLDNAGLSLLSVGPRGVRLLRLNDTAHLEPRSGRPRGGRPRSAAAER
jgi:broad specificity phosphatase PhoE